MSSGPVRDFDFHPDENGVRVFVVSPGGVLRLDEQACVYAVRDGDTVLWHYAFARHWFKVSPARPRNNRPAQEQPPLAART